MTDPVPGSAALALSRDKSPGWHWHGLAYGHDHSEWPNGVSADHMTSGHPDE